MGTITAQEIFDKAARLLVDETQIRWTEPELLGWLNTGQREIVAQKPNSYTVNGALPLVAGTKQTLPADALGLIDAVRNLGADGATPGRAVTAISRDVLDISLPDWHSMTPSTSVKHYVYDIRDPKTLYIYPPQPAGTSQKLEVIYPVAPADLTAASQAIALDDIYEGALIDYILFRSYSKDAEFAGNGERAAAYYNTFQASLGIKIKGESAAAPVGRFTQRTQG